MKVFAILAAVLVAANALSLHEKWNNFKVSYNRNYKNIVEEKLRYEIFQNNLKTINEHNARYEAGLETYYMGVNQFTDLTEKEFGALLRRQNGKAPKIEASLHVQVGDAPESIDWREKKAVMEVKDQGQCGSCWAFSATGAMEGQNAILNNKRVSLSEKQLLDCSGAYGNGNCNDGGDMIRAFKYVKDHGINSEESYPYKPVQTKCNAPKGSVLKVTGYKAVADNEEALKNAVGTVGPISVAVYAEPIQFYGGGIFKSDRCSNNPDLLDHGILAVGYGIENEVEFWIVKNSWGADWGEDGYFRLARNANNQCGIALDTSYPTL